MDESDAFYTEKSLTVSLEHYSGVIPAKFAKEWNDIVPGAAEKIFNMSLDEVQYRRDLEKKAHENNELRGNRGQLFGFALAALSVLCSTAIIILLNSWSGWLAAGFITIAGIGGPLAAQTLAQSFHSMKTQPDSSDT